VRAAREVATNNGQTYFVSFQTAKHTPLFRNDRWAQFLLNCIERYRTDYKLHDFVIMHDHIHLLMAPRGAVERSVQLIKGGYSCQARREFSWKGPIWQDGFSDHRLRDAEDGEVHLRYIAKNVASLPGGTSFCGAQAGLALDAFPQWLKPPSTQRSNGEAEAPPLQSGPASVEDKLGPLHNESASAESKQGIPQSEKLSNDGEIAPFQSDKHTQENS
jgi:putative transposase